MRQGPVRLYQPSLLRKAGQEIRHQNATLVLRRLECLWRHTRGSTALPTKSSDFEIVENGRCESGFASIKTAERAPRLKASMPSAPVPAKRSRITIPSRETTYQNIENSLTHLVGSRTKPIPFGNFEMEATSRAGNDAHGTSEIARCRRSVDRGT